MEHYRGGCACGSVRYELRGSPLWVTACHCNACKKRTGSAFGLSLVFDQSTTGEFSGPTKTFTRTGDFCPSCGTTVRWSVELIPGRQIYAAGTLDQPRHLRASGEYYTDEAMPWARLGCELSAPGAPDDTLRRAMMEKTKASR